MTASVPREALIVERDGPVAILAFRNRADGTMDGETDAALEAAVDAIEGNDGVRAAVLVGAEPGVFVRHYALDVLAERGREMAARGLAFTPARPVREVALHRALRRMEEGKPYIAALNGVAMGGGFEIALACDWRIAEAGPYAIGLPEINVGLLPGAGGTQRLTRLVGAARALDIVLRGRTLSPEEALRQGLVHECVPDARARALAIAREIAARPARAVAHAKRLVREAGGEAGFAAERTLFCDLLAGPEAIALLDEVASGHRDIREAPGGPA